MELYAKIDELEAALKNRNPNNAGRKSKTTLEVVEEVLRLRRLGQSFGIIAKELQAKTGGYICKSTVKKIFDNHSINNTDENNK